VAAFSDIWVIDLHDPYNPTRLINTPGYSERYPSWSADDSQIVFTRSPLTTRSKEKPGIFVMNADGTGTKSLVNPSDGHALDWKRCCPNCTTVCAQ
jgi:Tol biopolymer transport system component